MSYRVPDNQSPLSRRRLRLFNSFCFLSFIMVFVVGYYFVLIDLFSYPMHEWLTIVSREITDDPNDYGTKSLIPLIPFLPCSWICIYHEYRSIEYSKRAPSGVWYGICGLRNVSSTMKQMTTEQTGY